MRPLGLALFFCLSGALLDAIPAVAETPLLTPGKPAGVRQAMHEKSVGIILIGEVGILAAGVALLADSRGEYTPPTTTAP